MPQFRSSHTARQCGVGFQTRLCIFWVLPCEGGGIAPLSDLISVQCQPQMGCDEVSPPAPPCQVFPCTPFRSQLLWNENAFFLQVVTRLPTASFPDACC